MLNRILWGPSPKEGSNKRPGDGKTTGGKRLSTVVEGRAKLRRELAWFVLVLKMSKSFMRLRTVGRPDSGDAYFLYSSEKLVSLNGGNNDKFLCADASGFSGTPGKYGAC
jgi:hypothetical protein